jgi:hypothetical protein
MFLKRWGDRLRRWIASDNARLNDRAPTFAGHAEKRFGRMTFGDHSPASIFR